MNLTGTGKYEQLLARCQGLEPISTAVAHPCDASSLAAAVDAAAKRLIIPDSRGAGVARFARSLKRRRSNSATIEIVDAPHSHAAAAVGGAVGARGQGASS